LVGRKDLIKLDGVNIQKSSVISNPEKLLTMLENFDWTPLDSALIETIKARSI
jgi:hypothetical protein